MRLVNVVILVSFAAMLFSPLAVRNPVSAQAGTEAPTGFDNLTNGFSIQAEYDKNRAEFENEETIAEGLGPVYTARSCAACHGQPVTGGGSQVTHVQAGHLDLSGNYVGATAEFGDGSAFSLAPFSGFIWPRSICSDAQLRLPESGGSEPIRSSRIALSALGAGFVEAIPDNTIVGIALSQPGQSAGNINGELVVAPVFDAGGLSFGVGRFGWKSGLSSLLTFSAVAYLADLGITNRIFPAEIASQCDSVPDPEDKPTKPVGKQGIDNLANFMRSTKAPPRDVLLAASPDAQAGSQLFQQIGCAVCHVSTIQTAPAGTVINGGAYTVPAALGDKIIHPYSDFLLHNVGTGDGVVSIGEPQSTANKLRTSPLWGVRLRNRLMHDGESRTFTEAILRHAGEAADVRNNFISLSDMQKAQVIKFLKSL
jgi:CxxC motif-containing protein (DUF1111 family)